MSNTKEIRGRIKSVKNIGQITKAMELVSAAKMRKAQTAATQSRPYATLSSELVNRLVPKVDPKLHPLLTKGSELKDTNRALVILITSDRGLAGAFNTNVINQAIEMLKKEEFSAGGGSAFGGDFISVGKKGADALRRSKLNIVAAFAGKDRGITIADAKPIAQIAMSDFLADKYQKVFVVYSDFVSTLVQKPNILQILPFSVNQESGIKNQEDLLFEPNPDQVLENLIPKFIEFAIFQSLVEGAASEHSARMVAMRNANQAAGDLIDDLSLSYNQARQAGITRELAELSAAKLAMEG